MDVQQAGELLSGCERVSRDATKTKVQWWLDGELIAEGAFGDRDEVFIYRGDKTFEGAEAVQLRDLGTPTQTGERTDRQAI